MSAERAERSVARLYYRLVRWDSVPFRGREAPMAPLASWRDRGATVNVALGGCELRATVALAARVAT